MGFDVHQMEIPAGTSTAVVPLPHPFLGKINDKISDNVKIGGKGCATKGSKAKHDDSTHMQLPGTIKFVNSPNKEGEVTGGTAPKLKINGAEAACIGSMVTTCNDMGAQNNSTIIAPGASIPMPAIINPKNMEEWERERAEAEDFNPEISSVTWGKTTIKEGEEVELKAAVQDITDGNQITLQVFREGGSPEKSSVALARISAPVEGGVALGRWQYTYRGEEEPPSSDPKFVFSAHSAWCPFKVSDPATVELVRPKLESPEWKDKDGCSVSNSLVGDELTMSVKCTDMEDGTGVTFTVLDSGTNQEITEVGAIVTGGKAEAAWIPYDVREQNETRALTYKFKVSASRVKTTVSSGITIKNPRIVDMVWDKPAVYYGEQVKLTVTSFEAAALSPSCSLQLYDTEANLSDDVITPLDITLDADTKEVDITFDFDLEKKLRNRYVGTLNLAAVITAKDIPVASNRSALITVQMGDVVL